MVNEEETQEEQVKILRFCWLCASQLDDNNACTDPTCCLYGEPQ